MMMNHTWKNQCKVTPGTVITGKWHSNQYTILKELGYGANGIVYLAKHKETHVALKMSDNGMSITSEVNVLKSFAKVQGSALGPSLLDVDDWPTTSGQVSFYVMEYIQGPDLLSFIAQKGKSWTMVLFLQLLNDLEQLHETGWVFGDLKPENLIVTGPPTKIRCIDVGGTTITGRAIKEFTEFYDRGYWGLGSRRAEPSYDLFAVGMIMINTSYPKRFSKTIGGIRQLREAIQKQPDLLLYEEVILQALKGNFTSAKQMRAALGDVLINKNSQHDRMAPIDKTVHNNSIKLNGTGAGNVKTRQQRLKKKKKSRWLETFFILGVIILVYAVYIFNTM